MLKAYKAKRGAISLDLARADAYAFGNNAGEIRSPNEVSRRWTSRVPRAQTELDDLPRVTLKGIRHTHATLLLELGEHPKVVQERLGSLHDHHDDEHLQPSHTHDAEGRGGPPGGASRRA